MMSNSPISNLSNEDRLVVSSKNEKINWMQLQQLLYFGGFDSFSNYTIRRLINIMGIRNDKLLTFNHFYSLWKHLSSWEVTFYNHPHINDKTLTIEHFTDALNKLDFHLNETQVQRLLRSTNTKRRESFKFDDFVNICCIMQTIRKEFLSDDIGSDGGMNLTYEHFLFVVFTLKT
ncbi:hypothetical protein SNEBB_008587 [Seison nebaliae]|nr:hypothetical protein SNEBB_008587 [Seison nebaliae]